MTKKSIEPKLRFPEFDTGWKQQILGDVTAKIGDGIHATPEYDDSGEYFFINGNNLVNGEIRITKETKKVATHQHQIHKRELNANSLLLSINGTIGNLAKYKAEKILLGKSACFINFNNKLTLDFLYYQLQTSNIQKYFIEQVTGTTIKNLSLTSVKNTPILITVEREQQKIATFLTAVDNKIQQLTKKKSLLEQYKKGLIQQIFSKQIRFKDGKRNKYPSWITKKLGDCVTFLKGRNISKADVVEDGQFECIRYGELYTEYNEIIQQVKSRTSLPKESLVFSISNDVLIPSSGETPEDIAKACCLLKSGVALGGDMNILRTDLNGVFLSYYINYVKKLEIASVAQGNSVVHLYSTQLASLDIEVPVKEEQAKIASCLSYINDKVQQVQKELELTQTFKKALLQQMFV